MRKVGFTVLLNREDSPLSPHFGMAKWLALRDENADHSDFIGNVDLNGRALVELLQGSECTDVVCLGMGEGAFHLLRAAGIKAWKGLEGLTILQLMEKLKAGELAPILAAGHPGHQHRHAQGAGQTDCAGPGSCCGSQQRHRYGQTAGGHAHGSCCGSK